MKIYKASVPFFVLGGILMIFSICQILYFYNQIKPTRKYKFYDDPTIKGVGYFHRQIKVGDTTYMGITKVIIIE